MGKNFQKVIKSTWLFIRMYYNIRIMKSTYHLSKKTKDICEKLAIQCLEEMDFVLDGLSVLKRYILLVHKNLGIYKMSALSELVQVFNRVLDMAEENNEFHC